MSRKFVIGFSPADQDDEQRIGTMIRDMGGTWWHWIPNMWLASFEKSSSIGARELSDALLSIRPTARVIAIEVDDIDWSLTNRKNSKGHRMADWLNKNWKGR